MVEGFLEQDDTTEAIEGARGGEEKFTKSTPVGFVVLHVYACESLSNGAG